MKLESEMHRYQRSLRRRLVKDFGKKPGALLAVEMALGKTVTTASALRDLLDQFSVRRALIVAPLRVAQKTWPDEFQGWQHLRVLKWKSLSGTEIGQKVSPKQRAQWLAEFLEDPTMEVLIINRENVVWLYRELQRRNIPWPFDCLIYDESSRLKEGSPLTKNKIKRKRNLSEFGVYVKVRRFMSYVIELTGTPTPGGLSDLWGQLYVIDQGLRLGTTKTAFRDRWFTADYMGWDYAPKPHAEAEIMARVKDVMVSMKARDYVKLPPVMTLPELPPVWVDLSKKEMADYRRFVREMALEEHDIDAVNRGVLTGKLLQYANGSVYRTNEDTEVREVVHIHSRKLDALESLVQEINGANLLVAYSYKFDLAAIRKRFPKARVADEPGALDDWNKGKVSMLLAHPASIGHGMNIQFGGHHIVWYGLNASLELYQQFNARLPRPGQAAKKVYIHHIMTRGTFDERVVEILSNRDATQERIIEAVRYVLSATI